MRAGESLVCFVIDDSEDVRSLLVAFLKNRGHTVHSFTNAEEAWGSVEFLKPELLFLDWMLPKMQGVEFCRRLRSQPDLPQPIVVMVTAKTDAESLNQALDAGADEYIHKPFSLPHLAVRAVIAERRAAEKRALARKTADLVDHQGYLEALSGSICAGMLVIESSNHIILDCNQYAAEMIGLPLREIVGHRCHDFVRMTEDKPCILPAEGEQITRCKAILSTTQGERPILKNARGINFGGRTLVLESFLDIADLEKAQQEVSQYAETMEQLAEARAKQLVHADRLALLGTMSAGLAHEINNCITMIGPNAQMLERYIAHLLPQLKMDDAPVWENARNAIARQGIEESLAAINGGVKRSLSLLAGLKNYARKEGEGRAPCRIALCVENALQLCHNSLKYGVETSCNIPENLPLVLMDQQQIEQVLVNLINNASQAMAGRGTIRISASTQDEYLRLLLEDSGPGVPEENREQIWEPFFTTKGADVGTGLGLSVSKGIIDSHQGRIRVITSELGGAGFEILLPLHPSKAEND